MVPGTRLRANILGIVRDHKKALSSHPEIIKFKCLVNKDYEEAVAYNDIHFPWPHVASVEINACRNCVQFLPQNFTVSLILNILL